MRLRSSNVSARAIDGETIILDLRESRYFSITGVGTRIVELLASDCSVDDIIAAVADEYATEPDVVRLDVERFLAKLGAAGLLEH